MIVVVGLGLAYLIAVVVAIGRIQFHREVRHTDRRASPYESVGQKQQ